MRENKYFVWDNLNFFQLQTKSNSSHKNYIFVCLHTQIIRVCFCMGTDLEKCSITTRAGRYDQKFISRYVLADLRYAVYISEFCICIKQINKVNVTM